MDTAFSLSGTVTSIADANATCWSQWDVDALYIACAVQDDRLIADSVHIWEDDTVEWPSMDATMTFASAAAFSVPTTTSTRCADGAVRDNDGAVAAGVVGAVGPQPAGYGLELRVCSAV
ncbi:MAG: sugar-binding protein [Caldilineales bacterium]